MAELVAGLVAVFFPLVLLYWTTLLAALLAALVAALVAGLIGGD